MDRIQQYGDSSYLGMGQREDGSSLSWLCKLGMMHDCQTDSVCFAGQLAGYRKRRELVGHGVKRRKDRR